MNKLAEGRFNRVFLLTINDGMGVIAKIPYSTAAPKYLTTESEVATLDFLRSKGLPVPRVYACSSDAENEVGTEYVIMKKPPGKQLDESRWICLTEKEVVYLVTSYIDIERMLFSFPLDSYGSLYYKHNLPSHLEAGLYRPEAVDQSGDAGKFCIGPATDHLFWRGRHSHLDLNRGLYQQFLFYSFFTIHFTNISL